MQFTVHICAWCRAKLGFAAEEHPGRSAANYGICNRCLAERMAALVAMRPFPVERREIPSNADGGDAAKVR